MRRDIDDCEFWSEAGTHKRVFAVRTEHGHTRTVSQFDAAGFFHSLGINYRNVILAAHGHPQLTSIRSEERFMGRSTHINHAFDFVRCSVINVTEFDPTETTASVLESGE